jgi:hypothetical protein
MFLVRGKLKNCEDLTYKQITIGNRFLTRFDIHFLLTNIRIKLFSEYNKIQQSLCPNWRCPPGLYLPRSVSVLLVSGEGQGGMGCMIQLLSLVLLPVSLLSFVVQKHNTYLKRQKRHIWFCGICYKWKFIYLTLVIYTLLIIFSITLYFDKRCLLKLRLLWLYLVCPVKIRNVLWNKTRPPPFKPEPAHN